MKNTNAEILNVKLIKNDINRTKCLRRVSTGAEWLSEWLQCWRTLALSPLLRPSTYNDSCSGRYKPHTPSHGGCSSALGPHAAGEPWDPWQRQPHLLLHESPCSEAQLPGPGSSFHLQDRYTMRSWSTVLCVIIQWHSKVQKVLIKC